MTAAAKARLQALSKQLVDGIPSEGTFEDIPRIRHIAEDSAGQRVKGKVVIVTGSRQRAEQYSSSILLQLLMYYSLQARILLWASAELLLTNLLIMAPVPSISVTLLQTISRPTKESSNPYIPTLTSTLASLTWAMKPQ